jgi:hypothetical protein
MQVSDTVLGLVTGLAFAAFYSLAGLPIAWLADRGSRRNIIAIGLRRGARPDGGRRGVRVAGVELGDR